MRNTEISECAHLLMRWAIDSTIVIFHFLISVYARARPQNHYARPLGCPPRLRTRISSKNAEISANTLKMRIGCVIYYFTPRRVRELSNKEIGR